MVGILVSFWDGLFSGAFAVSFREGRINKLHKIDPSLVFQIPAHVRSFRVFFGGPTTFSGGVWKSRVYIYLLDIYIYLNTPNLEVADHFAHI